MAAGHAVSTARSDARNGYQKAKLSLCQTKKIRQLRKGSPLAGKASAIDVLLFNCPELGSITSQLSPDYPENTEPLQSPKTLEIPLCKSLFCIT